MAACFVSPCLSAVSGQLQAGSYFAVQSGSARNQFNTATSSEGVVVGLTRARALELDSQARSNAMVANTMWVSAAVLVVTGIVIKIAGPTEAAQ